MKIAVEAKSLWVIWSVVAVSLAASVSPASTLAECWNRVSGRSEFRFAPPGVAVQIPPDIAFEYGKFRDGYMLLPTGVSPIKWYLVSEDGKGYELRFPERSGTFDVQLPNGKSIRVRHGRKISTNSAYKASLGKEFEEIAWGIEGVSAERLRAVPVANPNVMMTIESELIRRIDGVPAHHRSADSRAMPYIDFLDRCRALSPEIAKAAVRAQHEINSVIKPPQVTWPPAEQKRPTRN